MMPAFSAMVAVSGLSRHLFVHTRELARSGPKPWRGFLSGRAEPDGIRSSTPDKRPVRHRTATAPPWHWRGFLRAAHQAHATVTSVTPVELSIEGYA
jgi:hypothetical protein